MSTSASKLISGCYCAEAMGFKVWQLNGEPACCAEFVLQDYGELPEEVTGWYSLVNKKTGSINPYTLMEINQFGRAIGSKEIANADEAKAQEWITTGLKIALQGSRCYLHSSSKVLPSGFKLATFSVMPVAQYPSLDKATNPDDDVPWDDTPKKVGELKEEVKAHVTLEPIDQAEVDF